MGRFEDDQCAHSAMIGGSRQAREDESFESRDEAKVASPAPHSTSESQEEVRREQAEKRAWLEDCQLSRCELEQKQEEVGIARGGQDAGLNAATPPLTCAASLHHCNVSGANLYDRGILEEETLSADTLR